MDDTLAKVLIGAVIFLSAIFGVFAVAFITWVMSPRQVAREAAPRYESLWKWEETTWTPVPPAKEPNHERRDEVRELRQGE